MQRGELDRANFEVRNRRMEHDYRAGIVSAQEFCEFYVGTLAGRSRAQWEPLRRDFHDQVIAPRIGRDAQQLVERHRGTGELVVLTTATNRFITELTAAHLGLPHLIATECETAADGRFTGRVAGTLNMREGKVTRLQEWLAAQGIAPQACDITFYSDSINDLPLPLAARRPVVVNPDMRLAAEAAERGWSVLNLRDLAG